MTKIKCKEPGKMNSPGFDNVAYEETSQVATQMNKIDSNMFYEVPVQPSPSVKNTPGVKETSGSKAKNKCMIALAVTVAVLVLVVIAVCIGFAVETTNLKSEKSTADQNSIIMQQSLSMIVDRLDKATLQINSSHQQLTESLENISRSLDRSELLLPSCAALPPSSPSGYYWVSTFTGPAVRVYCDMTRSCGGVTGGWMRVAHLDMTDKSQQCPKELKERNRNNTRTCVRESGDEGCSSIMLKTSTVQYSSVCGQVIAYQHATTDGIRDRSIDTTYVDGVSVTHGNPKRHIWTFVAAIDDSTNSVRNSCPCITNNSASSGYPIPSFVGTDYFCDTGSEGPFRHNTFYSSDPLWDGAGCGPLNTCCSFNTPPWFYKQLPQPTTDDIEMRVCRDQDSGDEDIAIERVDIFVR